MEDHAYDQTVSTDPQSSMMLALDIFYRQQAEDAEKNKPVRPDIHVGRILTAKLLRLILMVVLGAAAGWCAFCLQLPSYAVWLLAALPPVTIVCLRLRFICVEWILLYRRFAPERIRQSCVFQPSCSEYMLLAIDKYGTVRGILKGFRRLLRCHPPHGGTDYP